MKKYALLILLASGLFVDGKDGSRQKAPTVIERNLADPGDLVKHYEEIVIPQLSKCFENNENCERVRQAFGALLRATQEVTVNNARRARFSIIDRGSREEQKEADRQLRSLGACAHDFNEWNNKFNQKERDAFYFKVFKVFVVVDLVIASYLIYKWAERKWIDRQLS